jgi:hypothetical protein
MIKGVIKHKKENTSIYLKNAFYPKNAPCLNAIKIETVFHKL